MQPYRNCVLGTLRLGRTIEVAGGHLNEAELDVQNQLFSRETVQLSHLMGGKYIFLAIIVVIINFIAILRFIIIIIVIIISSIISIRKAFLLRWVNTL